MGVPEHLTAIIKSLYTNQEAAVKTKHGTKHTAIGKHQIQTV
jgi:hypothetical protein